VETLRLRRKATQFSGQLDVGLLVPFRKVRAATDQHFGRNEFCGSPSQLALVIKRLSSRRDRCVKNRVVFRESEETYEFPRSPRRPVAVPVKSYRVLFMYA
jgi:hypothetical protein